MLNNIQISRGVAALIVLLAHANLTIDPSLFGGRLIIGWCGVDFFFVLSGFIIFHTSRSHFHDAAAIPGYCLKRFRRVFPIYWIYTAIALLLFVAVPNTVQMDWADKSARGLLGSFFLLPTDVPRNVMPPLPVAWTLSYEVMFYALFAFALMFSGRVSVTLALFWVAAIAARGAGLLGRPAPESFLFLFTESRNLEFLMGCGAAYVLASGRIDLGLARSRALVLAGLALLALAWTNAYLGYRWMRPAHFLQFGVPFFLVVCGVAALDMRRPQVDGPVRRGAVLLGNASYSIYLTHYIVIVMVSNHVHRFPKSVAFAAAVSISLLVGMAAYRFIERPLMRAFTFHAPAPRLTT